MKGTVYCSQIIDNSIAWEMISQQFYLIQRALNFFWIVIRCKIVGRQLKVNWQTEILLCNTAYVEWGWENKSKSSVKCLGCNPMHIYLIARLIKYSGNFFWTTMRRIWLLENSVLNISQHHCRDQLDKLSTLIQGCLCWVCFIKSYEKKCLRI